MKEIVEEIEKNSIGKYKTDIELKNYTTYRVGGTCPLIVYPKDEKKLIDLIKILRNNNIVYKILGNGSNVLFSDRVFDGVIINLSNFDSLDIVGNKIKVGAGYSLIKLSLLTAKKGLTGLEFAAGIPGTVGGAVFMNAGAYKTDMGYIVKSVKVLTPELQIITLTNREMDFHYRTSFLQTHPGYICLSVTILLKKGKKENIQAVIDDRRKRRIESQPLNLPSAGSVFRNPEGDFAGRLIEELGYKGLSKNGAMISNKHANFIVNHDNAKADDIRDLILFVKEEVKTKYNIDLKVEQEFVNWE